MDEVAEAREAAVEAGIRDRGAVEEHAARDVEPHLDEILMRRPPGELAEDARKLEGTHGHRRGERGERVWLGVALLDGLADRVHALRVPAELRWSMKPVAVAVAVAQRGEKLAAPGVDGHAVAGREKRCQSPAQEGYAVRPARHDAA